MSKDPRGYYRTLGVSPGATPAQIKDAYRALAKQLHPDLNQGRDTTEIFQKVNEAYSVLSDPAQRAAYDSHGAAEASHAARSSASRASAPVEIEPYHCVDCGCVTPTLRHVKYTQVISFLFGAHRTNIWGVFCEECAKKRLTKASIITGAVGWLSAPGILYSAHALGRNLTGGKQEAAINMEICARQAVYYAMRGDRAAARIAAKDALGFADGFWWSSESEKRAKEIQGMINQLLREIA